MWTLLVALALTPTPTPPPLTVALFERPAPGGAITRERLDTVEKAVKVELEKANVPVTLSPPEVKARLRGTEVEGCVKGLECLFRVAQALHADAVIGIEATQVEDDLAVSLDAAGAAEERRLARTSFVVKVSDLRRGLSEQLAPFARDVARALASDLPRASRPPAPELLSPQLPIAQTPAEIVQPGPTRVPRYAATGSAVIAGGATLALVLTGLSHRSNALETAAGNPNQSARTYPAAQREADLANRNLSWALATCAATAALTATAVWLWQQP